MPNTVLPPTATLLEVADNLDRAVTRFLSARETLPPLGKYESEVEALNLFTLVIRSVESISQLARVDLVLLPSANALARTLFEIAVKSAWLIQPTDPFDREVRWLAHLAEEERMHARLTKRIAGFGGDPEYFKTMGETLRHFREGVVGVLPPGYSELPGNPSVESMLENLGQKKVYGIYVLLASFVHGSHSSTWLYRRNLGTLKEHGEFITGLDWYLPLWTSWRTLHVLGSYLLEHLQATKWAFLDRDEILHAEQGFKLLGRDVRRVSGSNESIII